MKYYILLFFILLGVCYFMPYTISLMPDSPESTSLEESFPIQPPIDSTVTVCIDGNITELSIDSWVTYALRYELPADCPAEFGKAMAVIMRTYAVYHIKQGDKLEGHPEYDFCDDPTHCKGLDTTDGSNVMSNYASQTAQQIIYFGREPINPIIHTSSSEKTASALEVYGVDIPYLKAVTTPDESKLPDFCQTVTLTKQELSERLSAVGIFAASGIQNWITYISDTDSGRVKEVCICGSVISGIKLASLLGLNSSNFTTATLNDSITFAVEGIGNGVGLSKYGAYIMAEQGTEYGKILSHYYTGIYVGNIS